MGDFIDYGNLMHEAMRGLIRKVLKDVQRDGLPGSHHFFITFDTGHPDAELADWLSDRYPDEMTVVMQHWYDNLDVTDEGFSVTLNFGDAPEPLYIPYDAIKTFVDPSVEFGLRFESQDDEEEDKQGASAPSEAPTDITPSMLPTKPIKANPPAPVPAPDSNDTEAEVVSLDSFRKP